MSEQETMHETMAPAKLGKEHEMLAKSAGEWNVTMKTWMAPGDPPNESTGTARIKMILDGHILSEEFRGDFGGMQFEGLGMVGYDTFRNRWWQTWCDNMSTGIYWGAGTASPDGKTVTLIGKSDRPQQNRKDVEMKGIYRFISDNEHVFESYDKGPDGKDIKTMEIHYRRR